MNPETASVIIRYGLGTLFVVAAPYYLFVFVRALWERISTRNWPATQGEIAESQVLEEHSGQGGYLAKVRYCYGVDGREYESDLPGCGFRWTDREDAENIVARHRAEKHIPVYYHPSRPERSVLAPGGSIGLYLAFIGLFATIFLVGVAVLVLGLPVEGD